MQKLRISSKTPLFFYFQTGISVEEDICSIWAGIVNDWDAAQKRKTPPSVKDLVRRGIPHYFRAIVWQLLCGASDADKKQYADYIKATSACEKVIRRDIARTYPEHDFFKEKDGLGQEALFNVMKAYSLHDREVGYCQGSGFIVGLLLMQVCDTDIEKEILFQLVCYVHSLIGVTHFVYTFYPCNLVVFTTFSVFEICLYNIL